VLGNAALGQRRRRLQGESNDGLTTSGGAVARAAPNKNGEAAPAFRSGFVASREAT
jgi:hypothetical protein